MTRSVGTGTEFAHRRLEFVSTAQMSLDARSVNGSPRMNTVHLIGDLALIGVGVTFAIAGYVLGYLFVIVGILFLVFSQVEPVQRWLVTRYLGSLLGQPVTVDIDDESLRFASPLASTTIPWSTVTAVRSNETTVVFIRDRAVVGYIPASAFASNDERVAFVGYARAHVAGERPVSRG